MKNKIKAALTGLGFALCAGLVGSNGAQAQPAGDKTITIARTAEAPSLDPHQATAAPSGQRGDGHSGDAARREGRGWLCAL